jgi:dTMP kinase
MKSGLFITFEGPDGSGKTTQIRKLTMFMTEQGFDTLVTREPGGTVIGEKIRDVILDRNHTEMDAITEAMLYAASRAQHVSEVIAPALEAGRTVICDRFMDSSIAYQGYGRKLGDCVRVINEIAVAGLIPDITFLLVVDPKEGKRRIKNEQLDRLELEENDYHQDVYNGYMELAKEHSNRIVLIDGSGDIEGISQEITRIAKEFLERRRGFDNARG